MPHSYNTGQQRVEVVIDYEHQMHHEGKTFHFSNVKSGIGAASYDYLIENDGERSHLRSIRVSVENGTADVNIYEAPTVSNNGVRYTNIVNLNRQSTKTPTANIYYDTTYSDKGTLITGLTAFGGKTGGLNDDGLVEIILAPNTKYLMNVVHTGSSSIIRTDLTWYEV